MSQSSKAYLSTQYSGMLSNADMVREIKKQRIIIEPFQPQRLSTHAYELTLGEFFFRQSNSIPFMNVENQQAPKKYWGAPRKARAPTVIEAKIFSLNPTSKFVLLQPHETILTHTNEFIGSKEQLAIMIHNIPTLVKCGLQVECALPDIGEIKPLTLAITNLNKSTTLCLRVGSPICRASFIYTHQPPSISTEKKKKYLSSTNELISIFKEWTPWSLLPYADYQDDEEENLTEVQKLIQNIYENE